MTPAILAVCGSPVTPLVERVAREVGPHVIACQAAELVAGLRSLIGRGARDMVVVPLSLSVDQNCGALADVVRLANRRWPFLTIRCASPMEWAEWADLLASERPVVLTAPSCGDPVGDANLGRLAALLEIRGTRASWALPEMAATRLNEMGPEAVLVPWFETALASARFLSLLGEKISSSPPPPETGAIAVADIAAGMQAEAQALAELDRKINELLPPMYRGRYDDVRPDSMGSAPLQVGDDGAVAWDRMWTSFCDLALAGGPSHRGSLLEAVPASACEADRDRYERVVAEIERGIRLVTPLPVVKCETAGWVGVRCDSEDMAVWLLRAIIVENVMVRREGDVLFLPAGPSFRVEREVKNVITVLAKTCHYWSAHRSGIQSG